jgi:16S rRNA (cytosine967-C5)-methyltransferase
MTTAAPAGVQVRVEAAKIIAAVCFSGRSLKSALPAARDALADPRDRALCEAIVLAALRFLPRYEFWLKRLLQKPLNKSAQPAHALLLAGLAQLHALALADYAAIYASVEAARRLNQSHLAGLVNALLRRFLRERDALEAAAANDPQAATAHPVWLLEALRRDWPGEAEAICAGNNREAPLWLRINLRRTSREAYAELLRQQGIESVASSLAPAALRIVEPVSPLSLPGWFEGLISVQDLAAQLAAPLLDVQAGDRVLDIGAAPGGKTAHLLELAPGLAELVALDISQSRQARTGQTLQRLGLAATLQTGDATQPETWWDGTPFDRILIDAPCSATGVIRRQPDIKLHRRRGDIDALIATQAKLLDSAWPLLRTGGRLVYATCSVLRGENERQLDAFLARTPNARALPLPAELGRACGVGAQRLPGDEDGDGFFYAALEKASS